MSRDDERRCRLESAVKEAEFELNDAIKYGSDDLLDLRHKLNEARDELYAWRNEILQVFSPPAGMVAVFERRDSLEEYIPVSFLALHRSGRVLPYILVANCESKVPSDYPNFLRIDQASAMTDEVPLEFIATEFAELAPRKPALELEWPAA